MDSRCVLEMNKFYLPLSRHFLLDTENVQCALHIFLELGQSASDLQNRALHKKVNSILNTIFQEVHYTVNNCQALPVR